MSLKPPLKCPPDYSILVFRLTECKKAGVVKGVTTQASLDLNNMYIPIQEHTEGTLTLKANTERVLNIDDIAEYGPLNETYSYTIATNYVADGTSHAYYLLDENYNTIEGMSFTVDSNIPAFRDFPTALNTAYIGTTEIIQKVAFSTPTNTSPVTFNVSAKAKSTKYRHLFIFDTGNITPVEDPGTLTVPYTKYEKGRVKYILLYPQYDKVDVSTCGCADSSGDMKSNQKWFQYVNQGEYDEVNNPTTQIALNSVAQVTTYTNSLVWLYAQANTPHIGYRFKANDMIELTDNLGNLYRTRITSIEGAYVQVDSGVDIHLFGQSNIDHAYSPIGPRWNNVGDFLFLSGATDIEDSDRCYIDTIVLKNPHNFDIPIKYMIGR